MVAHLRILAADIGGTRTRFGVYETGPDGFCAVWRTEYPTTGFESFAEAAARALADYDGGQPQGAVIATAGPVLGTYCAMANVAWDIDLARDAHVFGSGLTDRIVLVNDFTAQGMACLSPATGDREPLQHGTAVPGAAIGVIGAGTGLGMCALVPVPAPYRGDAAADGTTPRYMPMPSEGGHAPFSFRRGVGYEAETIYAEHLAAQSIDPTGDNVVSGSGLARLHHALTGEDIAPVDVAERMRHGEADDTLTLFARFYGRACRAWALQSLALGGLFVCGGVAAHTPEVVRHPEFLHEFTRCATYGHLLKRIPVTLHLAPNAGLDGAALIGQHRWT